MSSQEISAKGIDAKTAARNEASDDMDATYQEIAKDVNALTREEQMDVLSRFFFFLFFYFHHLVVLNFISF